MTSLYVYWKGHGSILSIVFCLRMKMWSTSAQSSNDEREAFVFRKLRGLSNHNACVVLWIGEYGETHLYPLYPG